MQYAVPKDRVIECVRELADKELQCRLWLATSGPEVSSFVEAVCGLFDDTGLGIELEKGRVVFDPETDRSLAELSRTTDEAGRDFDMMPPAAMIDHPRMHEMRAVAAKALKLLAPRAC